MVSQLMREEALLSRKLADLKKAREEVLNAAGVLTQAIDAGEQMIADLQMEIRRQTSTNTGDPDAAVYWDMERLRLFKVCTQG